MPLLIPLFVKVCGMSWSPDGRMLASGGNDNVLNVWEAAGGQCYFPGGNPKFSFTEHQGHGDLSSIPTRYCCSLCQLSLYMNDYLESGRYVQSGAATCSEGFVKCFLKFTQAVGLYCSCNAAQASKGNFQKTFYKTFSTT